MAGQLIVGSKARPLKFDAPPKRTALPRSILQSDVEEEDSITRHEIVESRFAIPVFRPFYQITLPPDRLRAKLLEFPFPRLTSTKAIQRSDPYDEPSACQALSFQVECYKSEVSISRGEVCPLKQYVQSKLV